MGGVNARNRHPRTEVDARREAVAEALQSRAWGLAVEREFAERFKVTRRQIRSDRLAVERGIARDLGGRDRPTRAALFVARVEACLEGAQKAGAWGPCAALFRVLGEAQGLFSDPEAGSIVGEVRVLFHTPDRDPSP